MLRLIGHGVVSEKNDADQRCTEVYRGAFHFVVEMKRVERRYDPNNFLRSFCLSTVRVKFKLLIAAIRIAG
jgi:hypothetical protein